MTRTERILKEKHMLALDPYFHWRFTSSDVAEIINEETLYKIDYTLKCEYVVSFEVEVFGVTYWVHVYFIENNDWVAVCNDLFDMLNTLDEKEGE